MSRTPLMSISSLATVAVVALLTTGSVHAQSTASTIRIEPRPYYGATVTLEQGVRVWRPLPPVKQVIVNPGGRTSYRQFLVTA